MAAADHLEKRRGRLCPLAENAASEEGSLPDCPVTGGFLRGLRSRSDGPQDNLLRVQIPTLEQQEGDARIGS
jgi:hypothetical protein